MSNEVVLLTVMVFMIFQGIAPFFWMPLCGALGRRPIFIIALIVFIGANIGLVFSKTFAALMILRAAQSIGSAALTATCKLPPLYMSHGTDQNIGAAVIGDVSTSKERGRFIGLFGGSKLSSSMQFRHNADPCSLDVHFHQPSLRWNLDSLDGVSVNILVPFRIWKCSTYLNLNDSARNAPEHRWKRHHPTQIHSTTPDIHLQIIL